MAHTSAVAYFALQCTSGQGGHLNLEDIYESRNIQNNQLDCALKFCLDCVKFLAQTYA